jgi:8-oxo-dGTP pyrophosphatase MutT (NUDIX family)
MSQFIDKLGWVYIKDKKLLVARSKNKDLYYIPGGKRELGETDSEALIREIKEELSVDLKIETLQYLGLFTAVAHGKTDGSQVKLSCYQADYQGKLQANAEIEEIRWLNYQDKAQCSQVTQIIMDYLKAEGMLD